MSVLIGTSGSDTLTGGAEDDTITGLAGSDDLSGSQENDSIHGGDGSDTISGGSGSDTLIGGAGDDRIEAGSSGAQPDKDLILPGFGADTILGDTDAFAAGAGSVISYGDLALESESIEFVITGAGSGSAVTSDLSVISDFFSDIRALIGSNGADRFEISGTVSVLEWTGSRGSDLFLGNGSIWLRYDRETDLGGLQGVAVDLAQSTAVDSFGDHDSVFGVDTVTGTGFDDTLLGDQDENRLIGLSGKDSIDGLSGDDTIFSSAGDDTVLGGSGSDFIDAGDGADSVQGGDGSDFLAGRDGDDTMSGDAGGDALDGGAGNDLLDGGDGRDTLNGATGDDHLDGGSQDDALRGGDGADTLVGGSGQDSLIGDAGADSIDGGSGLDDLLDYRSEAGDSGVSVDLSAGFATDSYGTVDSVEGIEWLAGTARNDFLRGDASDNTFFGTEGSDTISGESGRNLLSYELSTESTGYDISLLLGRSLGGNGTDWLSGIQDVDGSLTNDTIHGDGSDNLIAGKFGNDSLFGDAGRDTLSGGRGDDTIDGGNGIDQISFGAGPFGVVADLGSGIATDSFGDTDLIIGIENLTGTRSSDTFTGNSLANTLVGGEGNDRLFGEAGDDVISGNEGFDILEGGDGDDWLSGGEGDDQFFGGKGNDTIDGGAGSGDIVFFDTELATGGIIVNLATGNVADGTGGIDVVSGVEHIVGTVFADILFGSADSNVFRGLRGDDSIDGGGGFNAVRYDDAGAAQGITARLDESLIIDQFGDFDVVQNIHSIVGTAHADLIAGGTADESLSGGAGDDLLEGGDGNDTLAGGAGSDVLVGGAGHDVVNLGESAPPNVGYRVNLALGTSEDTLGTADLLMSVEGAIGSQAADTLEGDAFANTFSGGAGDDILMGEPTSLRDLYAGKSYRLYRATLDREPDQLGHDFWTMSFMNGASFVGAISVFVHSSEFQMKYGFMSDEAFVTQLYQNVLNRDPDAEGFAFWISFLAAGNARETVVAVVSESVEFQRATEAGSLAFNTSARQCDFAGEIFRLYRSTLDRDPDVAGISYWTNARVGGWSLEDVAAGFVGSGEFQSTYGHLNNADFVSLLYNNLLERPPDPEGMAYWTNVLNAGFSRSAMIPVFSESSEYVLATEQDAKNYFRGDTASDLRDTIEGGSGNDHLAGGIGADEFLFIAGNGGSDTIVDFELWDSVRFEGNTYSDLTGAAHLLRQEGSDVVYEDPDLTIRILDTELSDVVG